MHVLYREMVDTQFQRDPLFTRQLQLSFQEFINVDISKYSMAELFANFTDQLLRKGTYKGTENKKDMLENIISLFSFSEDGQFAFKYIVGTHYKKTKISRFRQ